MTVLVRIKGEGKFRGTGIYRGRTDGPTKALTDEWNTVEERVNKERLRL